MTDIVILTDPRFTGGSAGMPYHDNILREETLLREALEAINLVTDRLSWDDPAMDWSRTKSVLFRSTWDYFERLPEFYAWLEMAKTRTRMINPYETIAWNIDKHYLLDLQKAGIRIVPSLFIEKGQSGSLKEQVEESGWEEIILKPVISGGAWHTYRFRAGECEKHEAVYQKLLNEEALMIQEFQQAVPLQGEVSYVLIGGKFTHAVLKKARRGDFRVQDDYGGTVHHHEAGQDEVAFAEEVLKRCGHRADYARVDVIRDNEGHMAVTELELIEPELWFRFNPGAAEQLAGIIASEYF